MIILDGKNLAKETTDKLKSEIANESRIPGLAIIMIGNRKDSLKYVEKKREVCRELGIRFRLFHLLENCEQNLIIRNYLTLYLK